ncbi:hypothetical protein ACFO4E_19230 [Nocardiopsis mangrovi]|uniref:Uncharacterized protein n=1 Tax=Nocardiopsis mangrovi TaxID=1179818 RepID=A0ABV9E1D3_9ACTN
MSKRVDVSGARATAMAVSAIVFCGGFAMPERGGEAVPGLDSLDVLGRDGHGERPDPVLAPSPSVDISPSPSSSPPPAFDVPGAHGSPDASGEPSEDAAGALPPVPSGAAGRRPLLPWEWPPTPPVPDADAVADLVPPGIPGLPEPSLPERNHDRAPVIHDPPAANGPAEPPPGGGAADHTPDAAVGAQGPPVDAAPPSSAMAGTDRTDTRDDAAGPHPPHADPTPSDSDIHQGGPDTGDTPPAAAADVTDPPTTAPPADPARPPQAAPQPIAGLGHGSAEPSPLAGGRLAGTLAAWTLALLAAATVALRLTVGWPRFPPRYLGRRRVTGGRVRGSSGPR